ncbi:MAG: hypothetical protein E7655_03055 [Ruminococcaceae bacterium]|nr:hypothetical protein [Oscillospiraceae bacterium]
MEKGNKDILDQIGSMDDAQLREAITQIASSLGASEAQIRAITADMAKTKGVIGSITGSDLRRLEKQLGEEKMRDLKTIVDEQRKE